MKSVLAAILCLSVGLGIGHLRAAATAPPRVEAPAVAPRAEIHEIVRREIVDDRVEPAPREVVIDEARVETARLVVDRAKIRGTWTDADRDTLRAAMEELDGPAKADVAAAFSDAVNRGELRVETDVPL